MVTRTVSRSRRRRTHDRADHAAAMACRRPRPLPADADLRAAAVAVRARAGSGLWDDDGKRYLDFLSGLAVTSLGHAHPEVADAIAEQARTLLHVSNLFGTVPGPPLAAHPRPAARRRGPGLLLQLRRRGQRVRHQAGPQVGRPRPARRRVSAYGSFHGRTLATLHATGQPPKHEAFQPLPEGFRHVAVERPRRASSRRSTPSSPPCCSSRCRARAGSTRPPPSTSRASGALCDERGLLFMVDEVQTGLGRTGRWFGHQHFGVAPTS